MTIPKTSLTFGLASLALALPAAATENQATLDLALLTLEEEPASFSDALFTGDATLKFRLRHENVDVESNPDKADATTLRTELSYQSKAYEGFSFFGQFEYVSVFKGSDYESLGAEPTSTAPVVADPKGADLNQAYVQYDLGEHGAVRLGRQEHVLDNARFVGNVGWRQNHQSYDALAYMSGDSLPVGLVYSHVQNVNRIFGDFAGGGDLRTEAHVLNVSKEIDGVGKAAAYLYALDVEAAPSLSTMTIGASLSGDLSLGDELGMTYRVEYATQSDYADNTTTDYSADYYRAELGGKFEGFSLGLGQELLGSDDGAAGFSTPLATLHAHNGWADMFLGTPNVGLEDTFVTAGAKVGDVGLKLQFHSFASDFGDTDFGTEIDASASYELNANMGLGLKYADFSADDASGMDDVTKLMLSLTWTP